MKSVSDEAEDPFPGTMGKTSFSASTKPAAVWRSSGSQVPVEWAISNIRESSDGTITFDFASTSGIDAIEDSDTGVIVNGNSIIAPEGSRVYDISGRIMDAETLPAGIYIVNTPKGTVKTRI